MPGVNFTGGRRNAAKQRSRDVTGQKQRDHFQKQRRRAFVKPEAATTNQFRATKAPQGPQGINLGHAQHALRRHPDYAEKSRTNVQSYSIPLAHGILPCSPQPSPSRKRTHSSMQEDILEDDGAFEAVRRRLMAARNLVGLAGRCAKKMPTSSTMSASLSDQEQSERVVGQILNLRLPANPPTGSAPDQELEPQYKAVHSSSSSPDAYASSRRSTSGSACALIADPWVALQLETRIELGSESFSPTLRDITYPPREGFDIPECAGLDFRLARYPLSLDCLHPLRPAVEYGASSSLVRTPIKDSLPFPDSLDYFLNDQATSDSEHQAHTVGALSYWLDDTDDSHDDTTSHVLISPATMHEARVAVQTPPRSYSGIDDILTMLSAEPLAQLKSSNSHIIVTSSSPASRVSGLLSPIEQALPVSVSADPTVAFWDPEPVQGDRPYLPLNGLTLLREPTDHAGPRTNSRTGARRDPSSPLHAIIDNIIAFPFPSLAPLPRIPADGDCSASNPNGVTKLERSPRLEPEATGEPRPGGRVEPVSAADRHGVELKFGFSSLWDEDDDDE